MNLQSWKGRIQKGQTSLDFLMTYGWALLLIVIVIGALFALGVFNVGSFIGPRATGFAQVGVIDWSIDATGTLVLKLQDLSGGDVTVSRIDAFYGSNNASFPVELSIPNGGASGDLTVGTLNGPSPGRYYTLPLKIAYSDPNGFNYTETGTISGTVLSSRHAVDNYVWAVNTCGEDSGCMGNSTLSKVDKTTGTAVLNNISIGIATATVLQGIAVDDGSVWVANPCGDDPNCVSMGAVYKVNKSTNSVSSITVGVWPEFVAVDKDYVWVSNECGNDPSCSSPGTVSKIDKATETVVGEIPVGFSPTGIAVDDRYVWLLSCGDDPSCSSYILSKIDKSNDAVVENMSTSLALSWGLAVDKDSVWIAGFHNATVLRINKTTDTIIAAIPTSPNPAGIAVDDNYVWVDDSWYAVVSKIDKSNNSVVATLLAGGCISLDRNYAWSVGQGGPGTIFKIDKATATVVSNITIGYYPASMGDATGYAYDMFFH